VILFVVKACGKNTGSTKTTLNFDTYLRSDMYKV